MALHGHAEMVQMLTSVMWILHNKYQIERKHEGAFQGDESVLGP